MRTLTKVLSAILIVAFCLLANVSDAKADAPHVLPCDCDGDAPVVEIACNPEGKPVKGLFCDFNKSPNCELEFSAPSLEWGYTAKNSENEQVIVTQARYEECESTNATVPASGKLENKIYHCSKPVDDLALCLDRKSDIIITDLRCKL